MENENLEQQQNPLDIPAGNTPMPKLEAKTVKIHGVRVDKKESQKSKKTYELLVLIVKHPNKEDIMEISKVKLMKNDVAKTHSLWVAYDKEGKHQMDSPCEQLMKFCGVSTLNELITKDIETVEESKDSSYLVIKAF